MKKLTTTLLLLFALGSIALAWFIYAKPTSERAILVKKTPRYEISKTVTKKLKAKAGGAKSFAVDNNYNNNLCFLVDMSLPSGQNRFFVYDLKRDSILQSGLVTHGRCNENWLEGRRYGNTVGCGCTSLGKYKIGHSYIGRFGLAFKLYGLDKTNDKAYQRYVVLHAHECVPGAEISDEICQSDGCPTVSPDFLMELDPLIKKSDKAVLLWIFE